MQFRWVAVENLNSFACVVFPRLADVIRSLQSGAFTRGMSPLVLFPLSCTSVKACTLEIQSTLA